MFKKLVTFITKATKIGKIVSYIYEGAVIVTDTADFMAEKYGDIDSTFKEILESIVKYSKMVEEATELILEWLGLDAPTIKAAAISANRVYIASKSAKAETPEEPKSAEVTKASLDEVSEKFSEYLKTVK